MSISKLLLLSGSLFMGCTNSQTVESFSGIYVPVGYVNNFDTINFKRDGTYERIVYNKNKELNLTLVGSWELRNGHEISMNNFYLNFDNDLLAFPDEPNGENSYHMTCQIVVNNGVLGFCTGYLVDEYCYTKIHQ